MNIHTLNTCEIDFSWHCEITQKFKFPISVCFNVLHSVFGILKKDTTLAKFEIFSISGHYIYF